MDTIAVQMAKELERLKKFHARKDNSGLQESVHRLLNLISDFEGKTGIKELFDEIELEQVFRPYCSSTFSSMEDTVKKIKKYAKEGTDYAKGFMLLKCKDLHELTYGLYVYVTDSEHTERQLFGAYQ